MLQVKKIIIILFVLLAQITLAKLVCASYIGPSEPLTVPFGNDAPYKINIISNDMGDHFTELFYPLNDGSFVIADGLIIKKYNQNKLTGTFNVSTGKGFIGQTKFFNNGVFVKGSIVKIGKPILDDIYIYDFNGNLKIKINNINYIGVLESVMSNGTFFTSKNNKYYKYSVSGKLLDTYNFKPLELGVIKEKKLKVNIKYHDAEYTLNVPDDSIEDIKRDSNGNVYIIQRLFEITGIDTPTEKEIERYRVIKFNKSNNEVIRITTPVNEYEIVGHDNSVGEKTKVLVEYGQPVIATNGDVYYWKRTPTIYSIIKWTWKNNN